MVELMRSLISVALVFGVVFLILVIGICKRMGNAGAESTTPRPTFGEKEKESIRRAYERLQKVAEMTKQYPVNGRYMQVFLDDSKRNNMFVNFEVYVGYEYDTPQLQRMKNMEKNMRAVELYNYFRETPYEDGADYVTDIVFEQYETMKFVTYSAMDAHVTRRQIISEFEALGIHDVSGGKSFTSFRMY